MTLISSTPDRLFWTRPLPTEGDFSPEDPLALDYLSQQIGLMLLPGLTTRTNRAQYFAVVTYGLHLVRKLGGQSLDDATTAKWFERWERFWALATLEFRGGRLQRGDDDAMRGVRGAVRAWELARSGALLPLDYPLISRQQELGGLGAYLSPLRLAGLVVPGTLRPSPLADEVVASFWGERQAWDRVDSCEAYALEALAPDRRSMERKRHGLTLAELGRRSRLGSLSDPGMQRGQQRARLHDLILGHDRDARTARMTRLVRDARVQGKTSSVDVLDAALDGTLGSIDRGLLDVLSLGRAFGDVFTSCLQVFDSAYQAVAERGWVVPWDAVVDHVARVAPVTSLRAACTRLLHEPAVTKLRALPLHGGAFIDVVERWSADPLDTALGALLTYHDRVQRDRGHGRGWLELQGLSVVLRQSGWSGASRVAFPGFKIPVVQQLLRDTGR